MMTWASKENTTACERHVVQGTNVQRARTLAHLLQNKRAALRFQRLEAHYSAPLMSIGSKRSLIQVALSIHRTMSALTKPTHCKPCSFVQGQSKQVTENREIKNEGECGEGADLRRNSALIVVGLHRGSTPKCGCASKVAHYEKIL